MRNLNDPKVLILLPICNESKYLDETLRSVINQDFTDWILFAQDNASDDNSVEIIRKYQEVNHKIKLASLKERVPVDDNWNSLLETSSAIYTPSYFAWLGGDDFWLETNYLGDLVAKIEENPRAGASFPRFKAINTHEELPDESFQINLADTVQIRNIVNLANNWANALAIYGLYKADIFLELASKRNSKISRYEGSDWCWTLNFVTRHHYVFTKSATYVKTFKYKSVSDSGHRRAISHVLKIFNTTSPVELGVAVFSTIVLFKKFITHKIKF